MAEPTDQPMGDLKTMLFHQKKKNWKTISVNWSNGAEIRSNMWTCPMFIEINA